MSINKIPSLDVEGNRTPVGKNLAALVESSQLDIYVLGELTAFM